MHKCCSLLLLPLLLLPLCCCWFRCLVECGKAISNSYYILKNWLLHRKQFPISQMNHNSVDSTLYNHVTWPDHFVSFLSLSFVCFPPTHTCSAPSLTFHPKNRARHPCSCSSLPSSYCTIDSMNNHKLKLHLIIFFNGLLLGEMGSFDGKFHRLCFARKVFDVWKILLFILWEICFAVE